MQYAPRVTIAVNALFGGGVHTVFVHVCVCVCCLAVSVMSFWW
jgi:hypothetical protein